MVLSLRRVRAFRIPLIAPHAVALIIWILPPPPHPLAVRSSLAPFGWHFLRSLPRSIPLHRRGGFLTSILGLFGGSIVLLLLPVAVILRRYRRSRRDRGLRSRVGGFVILGVARRRLVCRRGTVLLFAPVVVSVIGQRAETQRRRGSGGGGVGKQGLRGGTRRFQRGAGGGQAAGNRGGDVRGKVGGDRRRRPFNKRAGGVAPRDVATVPRRRGANAVRLRAAARTVGCREAAFSSWL